MKTRLDVVAGPCRTSQRLTGCRKGAGPGAVLFRAALMICLSTLPVALFGHQDLLLQIERLDARIAATPASAELYLKRGDLYRRHRDLEKAAMDYATARQVEPDHALLDFYDGRLLLETGDPESAEVHLARYLAANTQHAKAWVLRGQANIELGQPGQAAIFFARAIANSGSPSPELFRLQILSTLAVGESQWGSAAEIAGAGVERFGVEVIVLGLAVDIALAMNEPETAAAHLARLPPALRNLPLWSERLELLDCLGNRQDEKQSGCLSRARRALNERVYVFMHD